MVSSPYPSAVHTLDAASDSPGQARRFVRSVLTDWQIEAAEDTLVLLVSELATNVVLHARTGYDVVLEQRGDVVRLTVRDDSAAGPVRRRTGLRSATGRGLALVQSMSSEWGRTDDCHLAGWAKGIWVEVPTSADDQVAGDEGEMYGADWLALLES